LYSEPYTEAHHNETVVWNTKLNAPEENNQMAWTRLSALFQCTASKNVFYFDWSTWRSEWMSCIWRSVAGVLLTPALPYGTTYLPMSPQRHHLSLSHLHTRSQAVARIADHTAWQQTIAIVAKYRLQQFWRYCALSVLGHEFDLSGSRDVIGHVIIWYPICHFLLVVLWNGASISSRFRDIALQPYWGSRVWLFRATRHYRSHDHLIPSRPFPIGGPLEPSLYH